MGPVKDIARRTFAARATLRRALPVQIFSGNLIASAATGGVAIATARALGPAGRGTLVLYFTIATFAMLLCGMGTSTAARYLMVTKDKDASVDLHQYLGLSLLLTVCAGGVSTVACRLLLPLAGVQVSWTAAALAGGYSAFLLAALNLTDGLHAFGLHVRAVMTFVVSNCGALAATLVLAFLGDRQVLHYLTVLTAAGILQVTLCLLFFIQSGHHPHPRYSPAAFRRLLRLGVAGVGLNLALDLTARVDRYLIGLFLNPANVGVYSIAATVPEVIRLVPYSLSEVTFRRAATEPDFPIVNHPRSRRRCLLTLVVIATLVALSAPVLVPFLFGSSFRGAVWPLTILLVAELGMGSFYLDSRCLTGLGRLHFSAAAAIAGLIMVFLADLLLIPRFELIGAAWASALAYVGMAVIARRLLYRVTEKRAPHNASSVGRTHTSDRGDERF